MLIKILLEFFKNKGYHIVDDDINNYITIVDFKTKMIITHSISGRTVIAFNTEKDIRFMGNIENLQQLKMVIKLVSILPIK